jgi:hypothetical protein
MNTFIYIYDFPFHSGEWNMYDNDYQNGAGICICIYKMYTQLIVFVWI